MQASRIAVIGAGPCGLSLLNAFRSAQSKGENIPDIVMFDKQADVGGLWNYTWRRGVDEFGEPIHNSMYRALWANGPKEHNEFSDYSYIDHFKKPISSFPPRAAIRDYILGRLKKHGVLEPSEKIKLYMNTVVRNVEFGEINGKEQFSIQSFDQINRETINQKFDYAVIATGHFSYPNMPYYPGIDTFPGTVLHAHDFRDAREFAGKHILVVGSSYSGEDIACQCIKYGAEKVTVSYRTEPTNFIWPKEIEEIPLLTSIDNNEVSFSDGSARKIDVIIFCTGYNAVFNFLPDSLRLDSYNNLYPDNLYKGIIWNKNPKCIFLGMQNQHFTFPMFDNQAWYARDYILGKINIPSSDTRKKDIKMWIERHDKIASYEDGIDYQMDYIKDLTKFTDYPKQDYNLAAACLKQWLVGKRKELLTTYREKCYLSPVSGVMALRHHTKWMDATNDTLEEFLSEKNNDDDMDDVASAMLPSCHGSVPSSQQTNIYTQ